MTPSPAPDRHAIGVIGAYLEGWRRVLRAPAVWAGLLIVAVVTMGATYSVGSKHTRLEAYRVGGPLDVASAARRVADAFPDEIRRFTDPSTRVVDNLGDLSLDSYSAALALCVGLPMFLWGGALDRFARARPVGTAAFFAACGVYFWRFLRLAAAIGIIYWAVGRLLRAYPPAEFVALVFLLVVADFAKARAVVEDRRSMLGALLASLRFIRRQPFAVLGLCLVGLGAMALAALLSQMLATAESGLAIPLWINRFQSLILILLLLWVRLAFASSEIVLFQHALAHAEYTAAPLPIWPDSPAAEAIENLTRLGPKPS